MFVVINKELALILFHKSAASSITKALGHQNEISSEVCLQYKKRIAFMRHPAERIESAYRMFVAEGISQHDISNFDNFILDICRDHKQDPHVMSQYEQCFWDQADAGIFLPTEVIRWDFKRLEELLGVGIFPLLNKGVGKQPKWTAKSRLMFKRTHHMDFELWERDDLV